MYQFTELPDCIKRISDGAFIPFDPNNYDYQAYLAWVAKGNVAVPAPATADSEVLPA